jgi:excisionase family DNA binding protein
MKQTESLDRDLLDAEQLSRVLGLTRSTVYKMARDGDLPRIVISRRAVRFERDAVHRWLKDKAE